MGTKDVSNQEFLDELKLQQEIIQKLKSNEGTIEDLEDSDLPDFEFYKQIKFIQENGPLLEASEMVKNIIVENPITEIDTDTLDLDNTVEDTVNVIKEKILSPMKLILIGFSLTILFGVAFVAFNQQQTSKKEVKHSMITELDIKPRISKRLVKDLAMAPILLNPKENSSGAKGVKAYEEADYSKAMVLFLDEINNNQNDSIIQENYNFYLALCQLKVGRSDKSEAILKTIVENKNSDYKIMANFYLGIINYYLKNYDKAITYLELNEVAFGKYELSNGKTIGEMATLKLEEIQ